MSDRAVTSLTRRELIAAGAAIPLIGVMPDSKRYAIPGPYRGKVIEVANPISVAGGKIRRTSVAGMMSRGMKELTGAPDETSAWRRFFHPGDVVGIKVSPVGQPKSISQPETLLEVIRGLQLAGVKSKDIVLFDRYKDQLEQQNFHKLVPEGGRYMGASPSYDDYQVKLDGYDPEIYTTFQRVAPGLSEKPEYQNSHLCNIVSKIVNKVVNVCVLKDHSSGGITMALKNMSHGMNNNVARSHPTPDNWCDVFISTVAAQPRLREKVVLQICDGLIGTYDGGPGNWNPHFRTWEYGALFFATDPVAMDRVGWDIIDKKRASVGLPPLIKAGKNGIDPGHEIFNMRQPQHVILAGQKGMGESDLSKIQHRRIILKEG